MNIISPLLGGILIGLSATLLLWLNGRVAGVSGIVGSLLSPRTDPEERRWRFAFLVGLIGVGAAFASVRSDAFGSPPGDSLAKVALAGLLVGFGTRLGSGCTSGHGVCGVSRMSRRSIAATFTFILFGVLTVALTKILGGVE